MIFVIHAVSCKHIFKRPPCSSDVQWTVPVEGLHPDRTRIPQAFPALRSICQLEQSFQGLVPNGKHVLFMTLSAAVQVH